MSRFIDKTVNQYVKYMKKTKRQILPLEFSHIMKDFLERKQQILDIDDHMMWLNIQNMFENMKNGIEFESLENNIAGKSCYKEKKIIIDQKYKNIELEDSDIYRYIKVLKSELQHQFDYLEDKDGNQIKCGVLEIKDGKVIDEYNVLNEIFNELKILQLSEYGYSRDMAKKDPNDTFELTRKMGAMWIASLGISNEELVQLGSAGYKNFNKKIQELNEEFGKIVESENQNNLKQLRNQMNYASENELTNEEKEEISDLLEYNYNTCMKIYISRVKTYFNSIKEIEYDKLNIFFENLLKNRCELRDIYNATIKEYTKKRIYTLKLF